MMKFPISILLAVLILLAPVSVLFADGSARGEVKPPPWSGEWWSRKKGFLVKGWPGHFPSPMERYDRYVLSRTGVNPGAHAWESNVNNHHYNPNAEEWEGHCNGWAAAAILEPEPREEKIRNGIVFEVADQKALLSEMCMNTYCMFYGKRYWGKPGDDKNDIYPDQFHQLLLEYLGTGKSAIICDTDPGRMVWNFPMYKFESTWSESWFNKKKLKVKTTCYFVTDNVRPDYVGTMWFATTFNYNLFVDDEGNIEGGEWAYGSEGTHPDFVWVPTADAPNPPGTVEENPKIDPKFVYEITRGPAVLDIRDNSAPQAPESLIVEAGLDPTVLF